MKLLPAFVGTPERNAVYQVSALDLLRALPSGSVDAIVTDPPYGVGTQVSARRSPDERFQEIEGADAINAAWLPDAYRVLKTGGAMYAFAKWRNVGDWIKVIEAAGFEVANCIIWDKLQHGTGDLQGAYAPRYEMILLATKDRHLLRGLRPIDILGFPKVPPQDLIHPYEKPVSLLRYLISKSTDIGDLVIDPFAGSGTSLRAAFLEGRDYLGSDVSVEYVEKAQKRLAAPFTLDLLPISA